MALVTERIPFGPADFIIGEGATEVRVDGSDEFQKEGGELTLVPQFEDIVILDFGTSVYDKRFTGLEGTVTMSLAQETYQNLQLAMSYTEPIIDSGTSETTGMMDAKIGSGVRDKAQQVRIHPRNNVDASYDIVIYKMVAVGDFNRTFDNTQGMLTVELTMLPRDNMNASQPGNFFYVGATDPNA